MTTSRVSQGDTHIWSAVITDGNDDPIDAATLSLTVEDEDGGIATGFPVLLADMEHDGLGLYSYAWEVPGDAETGTYHASWVGEDTEGIDIAGTDDVIVIDASTASAFYSGNPSTSLKDAIRFLIGDTLEIDPQMTNSEIAYLLALESDDPLRAAARAAERLAARYARAVDKSVGNLRISASQKAEAYRLLASQLWDQATRGDFTPGSLVMPWAGGINRSEKLAQESDTGRVRPAFTRRMMEYQSGSIIGPVERRDIS